MYLDKSIALIALIIFVLDVIFATLLARLPSSNIITVCEPSLTKISPRFKYLSDVRYFLSINKSNILVFVNAVFIVDVVGALFPLYGIDIPAHSAHTVIKDEQSQKQFVLILDKSIPFDNACNFNVFL